MKKKVSIDKEYVYFQASHKLAPGEFEEHVDVKGAVAGLLKRKLKEVKVDWERVSLQMREMIQATQGTQPTGYSLDSVTISLGFNAKGQLVFIAEAGVEATVSVTFKRA